MRMPNLGVRTRILAIALVPSLALVVVGVGATGGLVDQSNEARAWADELRAGISPTRELVEAIQAERRITLWRNAGADPDIRDLAAARLRLDNAFLQIAPNQSRLSSMGPESMGDSTAAFQALGKQLTTIRAGVDAGTVPVAEAYQFYSRMPELVMSGIRIAQQTAPDAATAAELSESAEVLQSLEAMSRATALGAALAQDEELSPELGTEFVRLVGYYRMRIEQFVADPDPDQAAATQALVSGAAWQRLGAMETALSQRALPREDTGTPVRRVALPLTNTEWQSAAAEVDKALADLWEAQSSQAQSLASDAASGTTRNSLLAGAGILAVAVGAIVVAMVLANRIIRRLRRLRDRTLALADEQLPETMRRLATGEAVDAEATDPQLDFGGDEIGQVAQAFGHAHAAAVSAAVTEARTREGVKAVFRNIAHRSQVVMHRQLELLDEAESTQEDPTLLDTFFRLDHLATRERRNAENLIILAGGQPGRQWRNPVPVMELVRSAVGETLDYQRVRTSRLPEAFVLGAAVGDLIHLLAELVDNATSFSPPQAFVEISGRTVARGLALEISDQGMGIPEPELAAANARLAAPVDFGVTALSTDSRLGLFVVSQLAARHGISVRLSESDYGGIRAIVLVPAALISTEMSGREQVPDPRRPLTTHRPHALPAAPDPGRGSREMDATPAPPEPVRPDTSRGGEHRPTLPRRRRQSSLAPELAKDPLSAETPAPTRPERTAEQARDLMSAIENGTRQGRRADPGNPPHDGQSDAENGARHRRRDTE
ncbi:nitrate- and nitrite sensing domain-containing protein [Nocardia huaxiensis]|uniref:histidine kinase n=1 Tax=Nocardia huaxiensis TaxID=2755382 RepID=A0A7D6ZL34_9NOCA|nr:nitrate- and nitrite sensing domain-containing protein [Nocardia huaxiensis]QLY28225.1 nitrate- and nitrite sensing domain-containing protein [Nocardia huaxiensis]